VFSRLHNSSTQSLSASTDRLTSGTALGTHALLPISFCVIPDREVAVAGSGRVPHHHVGNDLCLQVMPWAKPSDSYKMDGGEPGGNRNSFSKPWVDDFAVLDVEA
jgi:hypothetical protein